MKTLSKSLFVTLLFAVCVSLFAQVQAPNQNGEKSLLTIDGLKTISGGRLDMECDECVCDLQTWVCECTGCTFTTEE